MTKKMVQLKEDVYNALYELKCDYRARSLSDTVAQLFYELGIEPYDDGDCDDE